jgi:porin
VRSTFRRASVGCFAVLFASLLAEPAFAQTVPAPAGGSAGGAGAPQASAAHDRHSARSQDPNVEVPGTGHTLGELKALGYTQEEVDALLNQPLVPDGGTTVAYAMDEGWSDDDVAYLLDKAASEDPKHPDLLDGTLSALGDLESEEGPHTSFFRRPSALDPYFAWKAEIRRKYLLTFGGSWGVLWQNYTNSAIGQPNSVGSKFTFNLSYDLFNRRKPSAISFDMAVEDRRALGTALPPLFGGLGAGSAVPTAATWGQFDLGITQAYIRQSVFSNRFQYTVGKIFAPNFIDAYPYFDDNRQFLSQQFSTSPTIPSPLRGFGMVAAWFPSASNGLYIKPGMFTSNSSDTGSTIGDFFSKNEHFYMLEVGLSGLAGRGVPIHARGPMDANNIHITSWYKDPMANGAPRAYGFAFNANRMSGTSIMWFLRGGWSEGWLSNGAVSGGLGWRPPKATSDLFGVGFGWTHFAQAALHGQYTAETFYRFHVTPNFGIAPDIELILHPSLNPTVNTMWVFSLRGRLSF